MTPSSETARLLRRSQRIAQLRHPNLVRMLPLPGDTGFVPAPNRLRRLSDFTPAGTFKRFELEQVVGLLLDVLAGLAELHQDVEDRVAFVHREVSPQHIYVGDDGTARLMPLLPHHWTPAAPSRSSGYSAPELLLGERGDPRADLFSVGVMLWEALAGRSLFPEVSCDAVILRLHSGAIQRLTPPAASRWARPLCAIAERAISSYPELRFSSAIELSNAIGVAVGLQLAKRSYDSWQDEIPTLIRHRDVVSLSATVAPALPASPVPTFALRRLTPPATVLDIEPLAADANGPAGFSDPTSGACARPPALAARRAGIAAAVALSLIATSWILSRRIEPTRSFATTTLPTVPAARASRPEATAAPAPTASSAAPASSTIATPTLEAPDSPRKRKRRPPPAARAEDYGI